MAPTREEDLPTRSTSLQLRATRSERTVSELEEAACRLFDQRGFANVTVEEMPSGAQISTRTFDRCLATKDDALQLRWNPSHRSQAHAAPPDPSGLREEVGCGGAADVEQGCPPPADAQTRDRAAARFNVGG